ncbi:MAG: hypothetical protein GY754_44300, partial [bacterium]|nr:hypothetical protein [bacterium]
MAERERREYVVKRKKLSGILYETSLPNEYLIQIGKKEIKPILGGRSFKLFRKFIRVPASVQTLYFTTDNANVDFQGIGVEGYASWRINPDNPSLSITTLDFFDEDDPMAMTNSELKTICVEAVRHVLSNMNIEEALKQKEDIANKLKIQLKGIEDKWGIIFDQVGIEKVKIMSDKLFEELQSQYRDRLRLDVAKTRISTDRDIVTEENNMKEKTELEALETDKKIDLVKIENQTSVKEVELNEQQKISEREREIREENYDKEVEFKMKQEEKEYDLSQLEKDLQQKIAEKEREIQEDNYRKETEFKMEQEEKEYELSQLEKDLEIKLQNVEIQLLNTQNIIQGLNNNIAQKQLEIDKLKREIEQIFSSDTLTSQFIETLPEIYSSISIDNYSVLDTGSDSSVSPIGKFLNELLFTVKNSGLASLLKTEEDASPTADVPKEEESVSTVKDIPE